ncbi:MAG: hypothetical protein FJX75_14140 [Armatimonadetes bacterium]|nr:hypothetical protein [Armatimonadota bacterium]
MSAMAGAGARDADEVLKLLLQSQADIDRKFGPGADSTVFIRAHRDGPEMCRECPLMTTLRAIRDQRASTAGGDQ